MDSWIDTLPGFLSNSNEDEEIASLFRRDILSHIIQNKKVALKWLEIGPGNGNKTMLLAKELNNSGNFQFIELTLCEPDEKWHFVLNETIAKLRNSSISFSILHQTAEKFLSIPASDEYDFVSFIQVMYSESLKNSIVNYVSRNVHNRMRLVWIDVEDKKNDFAKMRSILMERGIATVRAYTDELLTDLNAIGVKYDLSYTSNKICNIDLSEMLKDDSYWLFPFLLGCNNEVFRNLPTQERTIVISTVRNYVVNLPRPVLNIPDISILIYC